MVDRKPTVNEVENAIWEDLHYSQYRIIVGEGEFKMWLNVNTDIGWTPRKEAVVNYSISNKDGVMVESKSQAYSFEAVQRAKKAGRKALMTRVAKIK